MTDAFNPWLATKRRNKGDEGTVLPIDNSQNVVHQTRSRVPTDYEESLADALEDIFAAGHYELPEIVAKLNESTVPPPGGAAWTEDSFKQEMGRLAADTN